MVIRISGSSSASLFHVQVGYKDDLFIDVMMCDPVWCTSLCVGLSGLDFIYGVCVCVFVCQLGDRVSEWSSNE